MATKKAAASADTPKRSGPQRFPTVARAIEALRPSLPVYALYPKRITKSVKSFMSGFPGTTMYAVKANPAPPLLDLIYKAGLRDFDTASLPEVKLIAERYKDATCHFMAPIRIRGTTGEAYRKYGVRSFAIDDETELKHLDEETGITLASERKQVKVFVRLSTPVDGAFLELSSKFGLDAADGAVLLKKVAALGFTPALTFHVGSLCIRPLAYRQALEFCREAVEMAGVELGGFDVGGGFPAPYPGVPAPPMNDYFKAIRDARKALRLPPKAPLLCEPGRALCAEGISAITQVIRRKEGRIYINDGVYGSFDEMTLPDWNIDYPRRVYMRTGAGKVVEVGGPRRAYRVYGPTCDTLDKMPRPILLPTNLGDEDWIEFGMVGAYSAALRTAFNGFYPDQWVEVQEA
ncbi:Lysine/ornithine decarboxylase [Alphaproteobacteria bacterium SO-S41]|nr:Lysine/ornithine decarboxylase [Alphaproteobacteria bacterium SO-S41]